MELSNPSIFALIEDHLRGYTCNWVTKYPEPPSILAALGP